MNLLKKVEKQLISKNELPDIKSGYTVNVYYKIKEGDKERIQQYAGVVIKISGEGLVKTFTVRKISNGVGVERIFPINSPYIDKVEVLKKGDVRRSKLYYLRNLTGKKARIQERKNTASQVEATA